MNIAGTTEVQQTCFFSLLHGAVVHVPASLQIEPSVMGPRSGQWECEQKWAFTPKHPTTTHKPPRAFLALGKGTAAWEAKSKDGNVSRPKDLECHAHFLPQGQPQTTTPHEKQRNVSRVQSPNLLQQLLLLHHTDSVKNLIQIKKHMTLVSNLFHLRMSTVISWIIMNITT